MVERVTAIDDAFGPDGIESFLQSLNVRGARISSNPRGFFRPDAWACRGRFCRGHAHYQLFGCVPSLNIRGAYPG